VAEPASAPANQHCRYARPDDVSDVGRSWRHFLVEYNQNAKDNPLGLYPAYRLYKNPVYERLVDRFGLPNVYILSAGWGIIEAGFSRPITTSLSVKARTSSSAAERRIATSTLECCRAGRAIR
jgi:hypothetical protein